MTRDVKSFHGACSIWLPRGVLGTGPDGARPAELFAMRRQDVDRERQMIFVAETLTRYGGSMDGLKQTHHIASRAERGRWMLFPAVLSEMLGERPPHVSGLLFPSPRGRPWGVRNFYRAIWEPAREKAGVSFTLYDLRHTFSSRLLAAGIPLVEVAAWMGHSLRAGGAEVDNTTSRVNDTRPESGTRSP